MLYMNDNKGKKNENNEQIDLFGFHDLNSGQKAAPLADIEPQREPEEQGMTPETLPLIPQDPEPLQTVVIEQKTAKKAPLHC